MLKVRIQVSSEGQAQDGDSKSEKATTAEQNKESDSSNAEVNALEIAGETAKTSNNGNNEENAENKVRINESDNANLVKIS